VDKKLLLVFSLGLKLPYTPEFGFSGLLYEYCTLFNGICHFKTMVIGDLVEKFLYKVVLLFLTPFLPKKFTL